MIRRREFIGAGVAAGAALSLGPAFWREALAGPPAQPGAGPYGPLQPPDANGIRLPAAFSSRVVAEGTRPVGSTNYAWHVLSDGQATFATADGGWILTTNSESPVPGAGGASAIRFGPDGSAEDAYRILAGTYNNCAGGPTPWGTWMSCEEHELGQVWECDPAGTNVAQARPAMGIFKHEAACVDPAEQRVYLSEDEGDGCLYRFTPESYPDLSSGELEVAVVDANGGVTWEPVPDPLFTGGTPTREQVPDATRFKRGEGMWFDGGVVYLCTTSDNVIHAYDTRTRQIERLYDAQAIQDPPLTGVDNVSVSRSGDLFVCEDNGADELDIALITPEREIARFLTATGSRHSESELTGVVFNPAGDRMYFTSQRAALDDMPPPGPGIVYEVTGPFRLEPPPEEQTQPPGETPGETGAPNVAPGLRIVAPRRYELDPFRRRGLPVTAEVNEAARVRAYLRADLLDRRKGRRRSVLLARATEEALAPGEVSMRLKPGPRARRHLRGRHSVLVRLAVTAVDRDGSSRTRGRNLRLNA